MGGCRSFYCGKSLIVIPLIDTGDISLVSKILQMHADSKNIQASLAKAGGTKQICTEDKKLFIMTLLANFI